MNKRIQSEIGRLRNLEEERVKRIEKWASGDMVGPFKLMYFPTNVCNLKCAVCWQRKGIHDFAELSQERQTNLIKEAIELGVREFVVGGGGEPLVRWEKIRPLFEMTCAANLYGLLFTNGTLITPRIASTLVDMRLNKVLVSLDGLHDTNDEIRGIGSFDRIIQGIHHLLNARGDRDLPIIGIGCVMSQQGMQQLPAMMKFLADSGCDQLNLIRLVVYLDEQRRFAVPQSEIVKLQDILRSALEIATQGGMVTNLTEYLDKELMSKVESFQQVLLSDRTQGGVSEPFWDALCFEPFSNIVIHANGMVGPCCMSGDNPAATVMDRSLADVWYGEEFTSLRNGILNRCPEPYCRICDLNVFAENQRLRSLGVGG